MSDSVLFKPGSPQEWAIDPSNGGCPPRICIITSATICCNPRVVKEADALAAAGYDVRVVASQHVGWAAEWDAQLMSSRSWKLDSVRWDRSNGRSKRIRLKSGIRQQGFGLIAKATNGWGNAERAYSRLFNEQLRRATKEKADLYIAHNPQALAVAASAAKQFAVRFAFDSEDYHVGEFATDQLDSAQFRLLTYLESKYLPQCDFVTTPSEPIANALQQRYQIPTPATIHNVFPWSDRNELDGAIKDRRGKPLSLYWYSQIIGLDRGIQDVVRAAALLSGKVQIHLRGDVSEEVKAELLRLAAEHSLADRMFFHEPVPPAQLLSRAAEHDVGLALEQRVNANRNLTVTNKVFFYLLAGLPVAATGTTGQSGIMLTCPDAGFLYSPGDHKSLAERLQKFIDEPSQLVAAKAAALRMARERWNWEMESKKLLELVTQSLGQTVAAEL